MWCNPDICDTISMDYTTFFRKRYPKLKILAIGDIVGKSGIRAVRENLSSLKQKYNARFTVINGENADMVGILPDQADELFRAGADVITLGNHTWGRNRISKTSLPSFVRTIFRGTLRAKATEYSMHSVNAPL